MSSVGRTNARAGNTFRRARFARETSLPGDLGASPAYPDRENGLLNEGEAILGERDKRRRAAQPVEQKETQKEPGDELEL